MKILRISLRNIASIAGTQTVDFTSGRLRRSGLYVICGPTGSGKTTLLDALCLALYERTPRLDGVPKSVKLADGGGEITQDDPRTLLRRGTWEGFAEVAFVGIDAAVYTARWSVRRARDKSEGRLQHSEMALYRGDVQGGLGDMLQGGKKTEVKPVIAEKVGLSYEQFTRAVLLAQNEFAAFLKADDKSRAEILQALTHTPEFEQISRQIFARHSQEQRAVQDLELRLKGSAPLPPEDREAAEAACVAAETAFQEAEADLRRRQSHADWFAQLRLLTEATAAAETALAQARAAREAAEPRRRDLESTIIASREARGLADAEARITRELAEARESLETASRQIEEADARVQVAVADLERAEAQSQSARIALDQAKPQLLRARDLDSQLQPLQERLTQAMTDREGAQSALEKITAHRADLDARQKSVLAEQSRLAANRVSLAHLEPLAAEAAAWLERLDRSLQAASDLAQAETALTAKSQAAELRRREAQAKEVQARQAQTTLQEAKAQLEKAANAAESFDQDAIAARREAANTARARFQDLERALTLLRDLGAQADEVRQELEQLRHTQSQEINDLEHLRKTRIPASDAAANAARHAYELAAAAVGDAAVKLRDQLVAGQECPVCGSREHPYAEHLPNVALRALKEDWEGKARALTFDSSLAMTLVRAIEERAERIATRAETATKLAERLEKGRGVTAELVEVCGLSAIPEALRLATALSRLHEQEDVLVEVKREDAARREAEKTYHDQRVVHDKLHQEAEALANEFTRLVTARALAEATRDQAESERARLQTVHAQASVALAPLLAALPGPPTRDALAQDFARFADLERTLRELATTLRALEAELNPVQEQFQRGSDALAKAHGAERDARDAHSALKSQRAELFAGRPANEVEHELEAAARLAREAAQAQSGALATLRQTRAEAATRLEAAQAQVTKLTQGLASASAALDTWLQAFPAGPLDRAALAIFLARDTQWLDAERQALDALEKAVNNAAGALKVHQEAVARHESRRPTDDPEDRIAADLAELRQGRVTLAEARDTARATLSLDDLRRVQSAELLADLGQRRAAAQPWIQLNDLIGSADGAKFRNIAQRHTLDILLGYANAQLNQLSTRYILQRLPDSLNLVVIDREMGDERRSIHSLSGGESFLVSLALALGLASLTSNRLRIESLFIDEGFGSLDQDTLSVALHALTQLEAQGRKVGVISHVVELSEAIPTQIRIEKTRSGASRVVVPE